MISSKRLAGLRGYLHSGMTTHGKAARKSGRNDGRSVQHATFDLGGHSCKLRAPNCYSVTSCCLAQVAGVNIGYSAALWASHYFHTSMMCISFHEYQFPTCCRSVAMNAHFTPTSSKATGWHLQPVAGQFGVSNEGCSETLQPRPTGPKGSSFHVGCPLPFRLPSARERVRRPSAPDAKSEAEAARGGRGSDHLSRTGREHA